MASVSTLAADRDSGPASPRSGSSRVAVVLTDEAVLPGSSYPIGGSWDEDKAALNWLPQSGGAVVLLPRAAFHQGVLPLISVLAAVDGTGSGDEPEPGFVQVARTFALRRVEVQRIERQGPLMLAEIGELSQSQEAPEEPLQRLKQLRSRLTRTGARSWTEAIPDLDVTTPDALTDWLARQLSPGGEVDPRLLAATNWTDRLPILELAAKRYITPRPRNRTAGPRRGSLEERVRRAKLPDHVREVVDRELATSLGSHGAGNREAVEMALDLVWEAPPAPEINVAWAEATMDVGHFGMEVAKRSLLDFLVTAEWQRRQGQPPTFGHALCLVGPPGTGKSTLPAAIAEAMGRRLEVMPMGGADDITLVGADRAYLRSRPGAVVRRLRAVHVHPSQVVFLLDELDKVSRDSVHSAVPVLLELLDPRQNQSFQDHFLDSLRIDLSGALFVATANERAAIPAPLLDRLHCVEVPPYTQEEQLTIARSWLWPELCRNLGVRDQVTLAEPALRSLVFDHPHSPGCRQLEQRLRVVLSRALAVLPT